MRSKTSLYLALILLFAFIIRVVAALKQELWVDEAYSIYAIKFYKFPYYDFTNPPIYFMLLKLWANFSLNIIWLRLLSILFSIFSLFFYFKLAKFILNEKFALLATFLLTISSFHIHYAWQIRMYSLFMLLVTISLYFAIILIKKIKKKEPFSLGFLSLFFIVNLLGSLTHYGFLLYLICLGLFFLFFLVKESRLFSLLKEKRLFILGLSHFIIPFLVFLLLNNKSGDVIGLISWIKPLDIKQIGLLLLNLSNSYSDVWVFLSPRILDILPSMIILAIVFTYGLLNLRKPNFPLFYLSLLLITLPFIFAFIFQKIFSLSVGLPRTFVFLHTVIQLIITLGFYFSLKRIKTFRFSSLIILPSCFLLVLINTQSNLTMNFRSYYLTKDYREGVHFLKNNLGLNDQVIILPNYFSRLFWYLWGDLSTPSNEVLSLTKKVEEAIYQDKYNPYKIVMKQNENFYALISYDSVFTSSEESLIKRLSACCKSEKKSENTEIIYCLKTDFKKIR